MSGLQVIKANIHRRIPHFPEPSVLNGTIIEKAWHILKHAEHDAFQARPENSAFVKLIMYASSYSDAIIEERVETPLRQRSQPKP